MVARHDSCDARPHLFDDAGTLVTENQWWHDSQLAKVGVQVGVAHPGGQHAYEDLAFSGWVERDLLD